MDKPSNFKQLSSSRNTSNMPSHQLNQSTAANNWDRYARKAVQPAQTSQVSQNKSQQGQNLKQSMKRYYRSGTAPKVQFKQYLSDSNNIFYEDRCQLSQLKLFSDIQCASGSLFAFLLLIFVILYFVTPFEGHCPDNAQCGVYVHCYPGFQYDSTLNKCLLSRDFYEQIENVCIESVERAREEWGDQICKGEENAIPEIRINEIIQGIQNSQLISQVQMRLKNFLEKKENQQKYYFKFKGGTISPTKIKYSLFCQADQLFRSTNFKLGFPIFLLLSIIAFIYFRKTRERVIANKIYQQLRKRTISQKMLNVSYAKIDLQKEYGNIDENLWEKVDGLRTNDRDIGFLQDDFLYWKML